MAGMWNASRTQVLDQNDNLIIGARAFFFEAGTTTPMTTYSSVTLGTINEQPHPVLTDGNGRWPLVFFDDVTDLDPDTEGDQTRQYYRVTVTDAGGSLIYDDLSVPIIGQSEGGGGGPIPIPIDETALAKTGDIKIKFGTTADIGWVRCNGLTIGPGGTESALPNTQPLYRHLWNNANNTICPVIGGRGANADADWAAGKAITLPDMRGRAPFGIDAMGQLLPGGSSGRIAATYMDTGGVNEVGASGGDDAIVLVADNIAAHSHDSTGVPAVIGPPAVAEKLPLRMPAHSHLMVDLGSSSSAVLNSSTPIADRSFGIDADDASWNTHLGRGTTANAGKTSTLAITDITGNTGLNVTTGAAHENMPPFMLFTYLIKL